MKTVRLIDRTVLSPRTARTAVLAMSTSGGSTLGPGGHRPPKFLDTVVLLLVELIGSIVISLKFRLAVVASQMMRGQPPPQIFFPRTAPDVNDPILSQEELLYTSEFR